ncbi:hypothetical protein HMPREF1092_00624 [Clostridium thermobutyricum]|uniref:NAD(+) hydrolase ThsA n=1 Tax=Clostridium thermobutyricum TaxID=29372 RepID=N9Y6K8_9CLOT|nr:SIR2 family protein [Clostridium thermobutyricum]ENZ03437.1 hypothetical protein HMPREF1092_00624 [Clostridium thermobutyricum]
MKFKREVYAFIEDYIEQLKQGSAAIFAGAGLSAGVGFVDWKGLLEKPARRIGLDVQKEDDLVTLAQYIFNEDGSRQPLTEVIRNNFISSNKINENHKILSLLPIKTYWTTNYDSLIEDSLIKYGKNPDVKKTLADLSTIISMRDAVIYKMHGDINDANNAVLIKDDYEVYETKNHLFTLNLKADLISKTFLFIGFSFEDPNLEYILSKVRILLEGNGRKHYCFLKKVNIKDFEKCQNPDEEFKYAELKQRLKCADLKRYCIHPVLVDEYEDITEILRYIDRMYRRNNVLISGSADEFENFNIKLKGKDEMIQPLDFIHDLCREISKSGFKIVTGYGKGIGSAVINGVLENVYQTNTRNLDDHMIIRPFPLYATKNITDEEFNLVRESYRKSLVEQAGITIFVLGNKIVNGEVVVADGVLKEFEESLLIGSKVIPIGLTGYASKELWEKVNTNFEKYYSEHRNLKAYFEVLGDENSNNEDIINSVCSIIKDLREVF